MRRVADIVVPAPPEMQATAQGAETHGPAYRLKVPNKATDPVVVTAPTGEQFEWTPTELVYRDKYGVLDYLVGSSPSQVAAQGTNARHRAVFPFADDVFIAEPERVKHYTILQEKPRDPAVYLGEGCEFGVSGIVDGVALPEGFADELETGPFRLPRPVVRDLLGNECYGRYEVVSAAQGQQLFTWFPAEWFATAVYPVSIDPTITTTTTFGGSGAGNQRRYVRCQTAVNGQYHLVAFWQDGTGIKYAVSTDNGATWGTAQTLTNRTLCSVAPADDDWIYMAYLDGGNNWRVGAFSPDANRTAWTASGTPATILATGVAPAGFSPSIAVYSHPSGTGWVVHTTLSRHDSAPRNYVWHSRIDVSAAHALGTPSSNFANSDYGVNANTAPCAVAPGDGSLWAIWNSAVSGTGIRARRLTYSGGTWTWGTEEQVYTGILPATNPQFLIAAAADSQGRPVVVLKAVADGRLRVFRRGASWTELTGTFNITNATSVSIACYGDDVYIFWADGSAVKYAKYAANPGTWGDPVTLETIACQFVNACLDTSGGAMDIIATTGSASPYSVTNYRVSTNSAPLAPILEVSATAFDAVDGVDITITHADPDNADTMSAYALRRGETEWWDATAKAWVASEVWNTHIGASVTIPAADNAGDWVNGTAYQLYAATKDSSGVAGPYTTTPLAVLVAAKPVVTILKPVNGSTVASPSITVTGQVTTSLVGTKIRATRIRLLSGSDVLEDTGKEPGWWGTQSVFSRTLQYQLQNGVTYQVEATVWDGNDVASLPVTHTFTVSFTPPNNPQNVTATPSPENGVTVISWDRGIVGGNQTSLFDDRWRVDRRKAGETAWQALSDVPNPTEGQATYTDYTPASGQAYEYRVVAYGNNDTESSGVIVTATLDLLPGVWLQDPNDTSTLKRFSTVRYDMGNNWTAQAGTFQFAGRTDPVVSFGEGEERKVSVQLLILDDTTEAAITSLVQAKKTLLYRDHKGRKLYGVFAELPFSESYGMAVLDLVFTKVDYQGEV